jgi:N-carbamoylputrescine amidase
VKAQIVNLPFMAAAPSFTVGIVQESITDDIQKNIERAEMRIREAAGKGAQIVCLQELFNAPYFCKSQKHERFDLAEPISGPTIERMRQLANELKLVIIVPIFERQAAGVYRNSAAVIDADGTLLGAYRKMHIPDDPLFNEKFYFTPGDSCLENALRRHRRSHLLGPVVSRGRANHQSARR